MADLKISAATPNPAPAGTDSFATNKAGVDFQTTLTQILSLVTLPESPQGLGVWKYRTETGEPPASGQIRFDNANISLATELYIAETNSGGPTDVSLFLDILLVPGAILYIQDKTVSANNVLVECGAVTDEGTYRKVIIANVLENGTEPTNNTDVIFVIGIAPSGVVEVNDLTAIVTWANIPDVNVPASAVTQHVALIDHDALLNFLTSEHFTQAAISILASQVSDFDTEVSNNVSVAANSAKVSNATHTGEVTGSGALAIDPTAISGKALVTAIATDRVLLWDATDSLLKQADVSDFLDAVNEVNDLSAVVTWANIPDANVPASAVTQHVAVIDHDQLLNFLSSEHFTMAAISITESQISDLQAYLLNVVEDLTPQLGGDLDTNGKNIVNNDTSVIDLNITAGSDGTGNGGQLALRAGVSGASATKGGSVLIEAGNGAGGGAEGGDVTVNAGNANGSGDDGGDILIEAGLGTGGGGAGGNASLVGGSTNGSGAGGIGEVKGGAGNGSSKGGAAKVVGGASDTGATGDGGDAEINGGATLATNGDGGAVDVKGAAGVGTGKGGDIHHEVGAGGAAGPGTSGNYFVNTTVGLTADAGVSVPIPGLVAIYGVGRSGAGPAGDLELWAGYASGSGGGSIGGDLLLFGGGQGGGAGAGGNAHLYGGESDTAPGFAEVEGGTATVGGNGGEARLKGGPGFGTNFGGGLARVDGGAGVGTGNGGQANLLGGISGAGATGDGGNAEVVGGASAATNGAGGDAVIESGAGAGSGLDGDILFKVGINAEFRMNDGPNADLKSVDAGGPVIRNRPTSDTVPTVCPNQADLGTGVGSGQVGSFSAIADGVEALRLAEANGGILQLPQADIAITAFATGGQGNLLLKSSYNILSVVATAGDSVTLPAIHRVNTLVFIKNDGANAADVFPDLGDDLGLGTNVAFSLPAGEAISFIGTVLNTTWTRWFGDTPHEIPNNVVQARRTTDLILTTAYVDVTLDATDVESDAAVIEHDAVTDRIVAKIAGTYEIGYEVDVETTAASGSLLITADGRVRVNDTGVEVPGSIAQQASARDTSFDGEHVNCHVSCAFEVTLAANDFVTLQLRKTELAGAGSGQFEAVRTTLHVKRLL